MIIFGANPVTEAIRSRADRIRYIAVAKSLGGKLQRLVEEAREAGVAIRFLDTTQLDRMTNKQVHNGVAADIAEAALRDLQTIIAEGGEEPVVFILDGIQDPQNLGAIIRVADCFGVTAVVVPEHDSASVTGAAVKASAGATEWVPVCQVTNLSRTIEELKADGFWIYGAEAGGDPVSDVDFRGKVVIVLGNEGKGIRRNVLEHCDRRIAIPMKGHVDSLNVAAAAAVIAYEVQRQRK